MRAAVICFVGTDLAHLPGGKGASVSGSQEGFWVSNLESRAQGQDWRGQVLRRQLKSTAKPWIWFLGVSIKNILGAVTEKASPCIISLSSQPHVAPGPE